MSTRYDDILFDADGTLFDFLRGEKEALKATFLAHGIELDEAAVLEYSAINDSLWKALERGEIEKDELRVKRFELFCRARGYDVDFDSISVEYTDNLSYQHFLIDGALDICRELSEHCRLFIITNGIEYVQKRRFGLSPLGEYFDGLFISGEIGFEKPNIRFFEAVADSIENYNPERTLVVGDSLSSDMKGGIGAGLDCCYFAPGGQQIPEGMPIKYKITKLSELPSIVLE